MDYLFFDIECANCFDNKGKICEFGYVLTDVEFNVLNKGLYIIKPCAPFDWFVIKKMLAFEKKVYESSKEYPCYFDDIAELIGHKDRVVIGHSVDRDAKYLNDESVRYKLPFINFEYYDLKFLHRNFLKADKCLGLEKICEEMGLSVERFHRSDDDALATMLALKKLCNDNNLSPERLAEKSGVKKGKSVNGKVYANNAEKILKADEMKKIPSFSKNHDEIKRGLYFCNTLQGVTAWDLRFKTPNGGDYLPSPVMHTIEHLVATVLRNSASKSKIIYFGPMGCRTGFYLLTVKTGYKQVLGLLTEVLPVCLEFKEVPGSKREECGNYLEHDLEGAKREIKEYLKVLEALDD